MAENADSDEEFLEDLPLNETPQYNQAKSVPVSDVADLARFTPTSEYNSRAFWIGQAWREAPYKVRWVEYVGRSTYPDNHAQITDAGHKFELDDSLGSERINLEHRSGTKVELLPNGDALFKVQGDSYEVIASDKTVMIRGHCDVIIEGNATTHVKGDHTLQVDGDYKELIAGNKTVHVLGSTQTRVEQNSEIRIVGSELYETRGNVIERFWANRTTRVLGTEIQEIGGSIQITAEGTFNMMSWGELKASFHGGILTLNGKDKAGDIAQGQLIVDKIFMSETHGKKVFLETELNSPLIKSDVTHATTFEGTAKRASYASTAGAAPSGIAFPVSASPTGPSDPNNAPSVVQSVTPVTETSKPFVIDLDRSQITQMNVSKLDYFEAQRRLRNRALLTNSKFLSDLVATDAVLASVGKQSYTIVNEVKYDRPKELVRLNETVPSWFKTDDLSRRTQISPFFNVAHMMPRAHLIDQVGLTKKQIADNMRLVAMNILEPLRFRFKDAWMIVEGLYNPYKDEKLDGLAVSFAQGLAVAIQFCGSNKTLYAEAVKSIIEDALIPYDKLVLSYHDYDLHETNEPCIILTLSSKPKREFYTEFNHVKIDERILIL